MATAKTAGKPAKTGFVRKVTDYKTDLEKAYSAGYKAGWNDYGKFNDRFGSKITAVHGYSNGMRDHKRANQYQKKAGK